MARPGATSPAGSPRVLVDGDDDMRLYFYAVLLDGEDWEPIYERTGWTDHQDWQCAAAETLGNLRGFLETLYSGAELARLALDVMFAEYPIGREHEAIHARRIPGAGFEDRPGTIPIRETWPAETYPT